MLKRIAIFILLFLCSVSFSNAEEAVKKYPPYPDVWGRELADYICDDGPSFTPTKSGEVIVGQFHKCDKNGEVIKDKKGKLVEIRDEFLFFEDKYIKYSDIDREIENRGGRFDAMHLKDTHSAYVLFQDGSKIRWIVGMVTDKYYEQYDAPADYKRKEINGILIYQDEFYKADTTPHTKYYNNGLTILEKINRDGKILWQKIYLYFHPWWGNVIYKDMQDYTHPFHYFKKGNVAVIDGNRMFLYFGGAKKIFRIDEHGSPKTKDKNLIVMDYMEYKRFVEEIIVKINKFKSKSEVGKDKKNIRIDVDPCIIESRGKGGVFFIGDYDYLGERISKKFNINLEVPDVSKTINEHKELGKCINNYKKMEKFIKGGK